MYSPFANTANQIGQIAVQSASPDNWKQAAMASAISGLTGGILGGMGANYQAKQSNLYSQALMNQLNGKQAKPEGISDALYADASAQANNLALSQRLQDIQNQQQLKQAMSLEAAKQVVTDPREAKKILSGLFQVEANPASPIATPAEGGAAAVDPNQAIYGIMDKQGLPFKEAREEMIRQEKLGIDEQQRVFNQETSLRKELEALPHVRAFTVSDIGFKSLVKAIKDPSATSDLELVRGAIQSIEPGLAVREGEAAAVEQSQNIPDAYKGALNKALTGGTALSQDVREGILRIAARRYDEYASKYNSELDAYKKTAAEYKLTPERVVKYEMAQPAAELYPAFKQQEQGTGPVVKTSIGEIVATPDLGMTALKLKQQLIERRNIEQTGNKFGYDGPK
jgi:hypothetical protein